MDNTILFEKLLEGDYKNGWYMGVRPEVLATEYKNSFTLGDGTVDIKTTVNDRDGKRISVRIDTSNIHTSFRVEERHFKSDAIDSLISDDIKESENIVGVLDDIKNFIIHIPEYVEYVESLHFDENNLNGKW